jgi:DNA repair exonuclease SbcCD ATPase subunit
MESDIKRYSKEIDLLSSQIISGKEEFVCDKCKSMVSRKHIESEIDKNKKEKEKIEAEISKLRDEQNKCVDDLKKLQENMEKINGWINKEGQINSNIKDFRNNEEKIKELEASLKEFDTNDKRLLNEQKELEEKKSQYLLKIEEISKVFNSEIALLEKKYRELAEKYKELEKSSTETKNKMDAIKKQIEEKSQFKSQYNSQIGSLRKEIEIMGEVKKQLIELRKKYEVEKLVFARMSVLDSCLGLEGIQVRIIQKYLPLLNVYIEEFMSLLSNGSMSANVIINDKSQIDVIIKGGSADTYKMLSGGEKTTCKLAISVGLALLSFTRCNHKAEFIALDELFGALDNSHIEMAFKLLNKLKDKFSRILVISHKKEINDRIPHRILVEKDEGIFGRSRIKEVV